jgi:hypothetical protein
MFPRISTSLTALMLVGLVAFPAVAADLDSFAYVTIVDGITIVETTALDFGEIALADGTITVTTAGAVLDPDFLSFSSVTASQGIFELTVVPGGSYDISLLENVPAAGLTLNNFQINIDGGADEVGSDNFLGVTLPNQISDLNVGADLTVDALNASLGANQTIGYRISVNFN